MLEKHEMEETWENIFTGTPQSPFSFPKKKNYEFIKSETVFATKYPHFMFHVAITQVT